MFFSPNHSHLKSHVYRAIDEGHDAVTVPQFVSALNFDGGVKGAKNLKGEKSQ